MYHTSLQRGSNDAHDQRLKISINCSFYRTSVQCRCNDAHSMLKISINCFFLYYIALIQGRCRSAHLPRYSHHRPVPIASPRNSAHTHGTPSPTPDTYTVQRDQSLTKMAKSFQFENLIGMSRYN